LLAIYPENDCVLETIHDFEASTGVSKFIDVNMKLLLFCLLLLAPALSHSADTDTRTLRVFIFAGQSNRMNPAV
jgi:hypothetical protein